MRAEQHIAVGEGGLYSALLGKEKEGAESPRMDHVGGVTHRFSPTAPQRPMKLRLSLNITLWKMMVGKCMIIIHQTKM